MQKTITPIDNTVYVTREYHSGKIEETISNSIKAQKTWAALEVKERVKLLANFVKDFLSRGDVIGEELSRQIGRPISQAIGELNGFKERADYMLSIAEKKLENIDVTKDNNFKSASVNGNKTPIIMLVGQISQIDHMDKEAIQSKYLK